MATFLSLEGKKEEEKPQPSEDEVERSFKRYKELISSLPKAKGWALEHLHQYQGFWYHHPHCEGVMALQQYFVAKSSDIFLTSIPKSGTTWFKAILFAIMNRTYCNMSDHPLLKSNPHDLVPFLDIQLFVKPPIARVENFPSPRLFAAHTPFSSLSQSIKSSDCRIVYICRNPKDVLVSAWKFTSKLRDEKLPPISLEEAYDLFCGGISPFGPYWDHVDGYKKASIEWPERVFFITYEDMKNDPLRNLKRLAEFVGQPFTPEEENDGMLEGIFKLCSFQNMKSLEVNKTGTMFNGKTTNDVFFREGKVGDWINHLTTEMIENLDEITKEKLGDLFNPQIFIH